MRNIKTGADKIVAKKVGPRLHLLLIIREKNIIVPQSKPDSGVTNK